MEDEEKIETIEDFLEHEYCISNPSEAVKEKYFNDYQNYLYSLKNGEL